MPRWRGIASTDQYWPSVSPCSIYSLLKGVQVETEAIKAAIWGTDSMQNSSQSILLNMFDPVRSCQWCCCCCLILIIHYFITYINTTKGTDVLNQCKPLLPFNTLSLKKWAFADPVEYVPGPLKILSYRRISALQGSFYCIALSSRVNIKTHPSSRSKTVLKGQDCILSKTLI